MAATTENNFDLSNWKTNPYSEHAFVNVDKILKTETIKKSDAPAVPLDKSTVTLDDFNVKFGDQTLDLGAFLSSTNSDGFLVLHKGKLVHESYAHGNDANSQHIVMPMTKSVTGLVVGRLVEQGFLDTKAKVVLYLPEAKGTPYENVTVRNLLDMRSGAQYSDEAHEYRFATGWEPAHEGEAPTNLLEFISKLRAPTNGPGGAFEYSSINTDVLGLVIERANGKKLADLIQEYIWQAIGAESDALLTVDSADNPRAAGGMCATVRDLARLGQAIIAGKVVPKAWLDDILTGGDAGILAGTSFGALRELIGDGTAYRSCWVANGEVGILMALGVHGQTLVVDLKNEIVMVKTSSQPHPTTKGGANVVGFLEVRRVVLVQSG